MKDFMAYVFKEYEGIAVPIAIMFALVSSGCLMTIMIVGTVTLLEIIAA